jgi:hypothetical protein
LELDRALLSTLRVKAPGVDEIASGESSASLDDDQWGEKIDIVILEAGL